MVKLRDLEGVSSIIVTHQLRDAFFVATHEAVRDGNGFRIVPADAQKCDEAEFVMLKDGLVHFEGNAAELRASKDDYIQQFLS
jgi:phospholipid/cholesterol/gamma-HCH transport system ATP-binding protein